MARQGCEKHQARAVISCEACYPDDVLQAEIAHLQSTSMPSAPSSAPKRPKRTDDPGSSKKRKSVFDQLDT